MLLFTAVVSAPALATEPTTGAFVSPGALAASHAELDGLTACATCHAPGNDRSGKACTASCHDTIRAQVTASEGLHGHDSRADCFSCHPDHRGRDFALVDYVKFEASTSPADHLVETTFALEGAHAGLACRECHAVLGTYTAPAQDRCEACHVAKGLKTAP